ncbi:MAG: DUF424 family protein [Sulfolobaceae archaeon]|nr:DUF424 family protein [Sulfolobales archaeon]
MIVLLSVRRFENVKIVGVVEPALLGKVYRNGIKVLDVSEDFYSGEQVDLNVALDEVRTATVATLIGNTVVEEALKQGLIAAYDEVEGVKFAQMFNM